MVHKWPHGHAPGRRYGDTNGYTKEKPMDRDTSIMNWQRRHDAYVDAAATLAGCIDRAMAEGIDVNTDPAVALYLGEYRAAQAAL